MPRFRVLRRVDAWIDYVADIEAESALEAAQKANLDQRNYQWTRVGEDEFPNAMHVALDRNGEEIRGTEQMTG